MPTALQLSPKNQRNKQVQDLARRYASARASLTRANKKRRELEASAPVMAAIGTTAGGVAAAAADAYLPQLSVGGLPPSVIIGAAIMAYGWSEDDVTLVSLGAGMTTNYVYTKTGEAILAMQQEG